jgi:hypothetical protein
MKKGIILTGTLVSLAASTALAGDDLFSYQERGNYQGPSSDQSTDDRYRANELSLDAFGGITVQESIIEHASGDRVRQNGRLGLGAGANYFFTRYIGIGGDGYTENTAHNFVDNVSGSLIGRLPLGNSGIAPYIFGGGGHLFDPRVATEGHGGAGIEFRVNPHFSIFTDARMVFTDRLGNYGLGRLGLRFVF